MNIFATLYQKHKNIINDLLHLAIAEDGKDITSINLFPANKQTKAYIIAKQKGIISGLPLLPIILKQANTHLDLKFYFKDGDKITPGDKIVELKGTARDILFFERIFLNFLTHLAGISTLTSQYVQKAQPYGVTILDTRKTLPGHRILEKYAVKIGGGQNHRLNLTDMIMLKDNHIDLYGSIKKAVNCLCTSISPCPPIEVECSSLAQVQEAISSAVQRIMLDNMPIDQIKIALSLIPKHIETEISGNIDLSNIEKFAALKPNFISVGKLTHSAPALDLSLKISN
ncbi:MAG: carboxylating nicotinate-nucleotide diphosphorylase [Desulfonauticus sp.]|nr:carboxylating nicotinate-nucleotide diphosphorylase [Desulfonauticus sp.]